MRSGLRLRTLLVVLAVVFTLSAQASVIITNFPQGGAVSNTAVDNGNYLAAGFTMPADSTYVLDDIRVELRYATTHPVTSFTAQLLGSDVSGNPTGPALVTFAAPSPFTSGPSVYILAPLSTVFLDAGATYWIEINAADNDIGGLSWMGSFPGVTATGIATAAGYRYSTSNPPQTAYAFASPTFQVDGTVAPEPGTFLLLGGALLVVRIYKARK